MLLFQVIGIIFLILLTIFYKDHFKLYWGKVASFLAFMIFLTCFRIGISSFDMDLPSIIKGSNLVSKAFEPWSFLLVWLEDCFFTLPIIFFKEWKVSRWSFVLMVLLSSIGFGSGHLYQGYGFALLACLYPYFISYKMTLKHGFITVMMCHVLYDFITFITIKLMPYILLSFPIVNK
jgi:hypothetical protein